MTQGNGNEERSAIGRGSADGVHAGEDEPEIAEAASLEPQIQEQLGRVLRSFCDDLIHQPVPDKFVALLAKLEAKQRERK
jgi:hypothetical protein